MPQVDDGGPAFPCHLPDEGNYADGMSLRDWFAGEAISATPLLEERDQDRAAALAYAQADAMIAAREEGEPNNAK